MWSITPFWSRFAELSQLTFGKCFNQPITGKVLPSKLSKLTLVIRGLGARRKATFNKPITSGILPSKLKKLIFSEHINQPLTSGVLLSRFAELYQLTFGWRFNQLLICGVLPSKLNQLTFGDKFNQPLTCGVLPLTLSQLKFGSDFDQALTCGVLPLRFAELSRLTIHKSYMHRLNKALIMNRNVHYL